MLNKIVSWRSTIVAKTTLPYVASSWFGWATPNAAKLIPAMNVTRIRAALGGLVIVSGEEYLSLLWPSYDYLKSDKRSIGNASKALTFPMNSYFIRA